MRTSRIVVQTTPEVKALLKRIADNEGRTMSNLVERFITSAGAGLEEEDYPKVAIAINNHKA